MFQEVLFIVDAWQLGVGRKEVIREQELDGKEKEGQGHV